jgi:hypothetical protein
VARAPISDAGLEALARLDEPVSVVRVGISDTPRTMTVAYVWGTGGKGLGVALRAEDAREPRVRLAGASAAADPLTDLVAVLRANSLLTEEALSEWTRRRHNARQVADLDAWTLTD